MKVAHVSYADARGGAAIGARRSHEAMLSKLDSTLFVVKKYSTDPSVIQLDDPLGDREFATRLDRFLAQRFQSPNKIFRSYNLVNTGTFNRINDYSPDIVQLHWIGQNTLGINELPLIRAPIVWKLPDMWPFCGSEHYCRLDNDRRHIEGYSTFNRKFDEGGWDVDRLIWRIKQKAWQRLNITLVAPSRWLADEARKSKIFREKRVIHINNPINTVRFKILNKTELQKKYNLDPEKVTIIYGAMNAEEDIRKGYADILELIPRLGLLSKETPIQILIFGSNNTEQICKYGINIHKQKQINDSKTLIELYNTADILLFPTRQDNSPNIVKEASCCGVITVAYRIGGLPDLVTHLKTGYLAEPFSVDDLYQGIIWALRNKHKKLHQEVADQARKRHDPDLISEKYLNLYQALIAQPKNSY
jgi:glycosyltransferase involved in cell wall biosynthesis